LKKIQAILQDTDVRLTFLHFLRLFSVCPGVLEQVRIRESCPPDRRQICVRKHADFKVLDWRLQLIFVHFISFFVQVV